MEIKKLDLIDRNALYEKAYFHGKLPDPGCLYPDGKEAVDVDDIDDAPTIDAVKVVHGRWIDKGWDGDFSWRIDGHGNCWHVYECSNCKNELCGIPKTNYCPECGARMDG